MFHVECENHLSGARWETLGNPRWRWSWTGADCSASKAMTFEYPNISTLPQYLVNRNEQFCYCSYDLCNGGSLTGPPLSLSSTSQFSLRLGKSSKNGYFTVRLAVGGGEALTVSICENFYLLGQSLVDKQTDTQARIHRPIKRKWWFFVTDTFRYWRGDPTDLLDV